MLYEVITHYAYTTTESFANLDKNGIAIPEEDGSYKMVDMGKRICFGVGQNKNRRSGNTNKGLLMAWVMAMTHKGTDGSGIPTTHLPRDARPITCRWWRESTFRAGVITSYSIHYTKLYELESYIDTPDTDYPVGEFIGSDFNIV